MILTGSGTLENLFKLIGLLVVFVVIIVACYYVTKLVGTRQLTKSAKSNFKILDSYKLGPNQILAIVEVGERYFCIGITKEQISMISELNASDFVMDTAGKTTSFAGIFATVMNKEKAKTEKQSFPEYDNKTPEDSETSEKED